MDGVVFRQNRGGLRDNYFTSPTSDNVAYRLDQPRPKDTHRVLKTRFPV